MQFEDRAHALLRSKKYRREYNEYLRLQAQKGIEDMAVLDYITPISDISTEGIALCKKYKMHFPINPDNYSKDFLTIEEELQTVQRHMPSVLPVALEKLPEDRVSTADYENAEKLYGPKEGRYLIVSVDITRKLPEITREISRLHKYYKSSTRDKAAVADHWEVYDLHEEGMDIDQITQKIFEWEEKLKFTDQQGEIYKTKRATVRDCLKKARGLMKDFEEGR